MIGDKGEGMRKGKREIPVAALEIILGLGVISQFYHPAVRWGDLIPRSISVFTYGEEGYDSQRSTGRSSSPSRHLVRAGHASLACPSL